MHLKPVDVVNEIDRESFRKRYYEPQLPLVIRHLSRDWPAYSKWSWDYLASVAGDKTVGIYNNSKSDAHTPVNRADDYTSFGEYIDMVRRGPAAWRIFLFNIFHHAPQLKEDFSWPDHLLNGFVKKLPMLFVGGQGSITHMHFDIDLSHIMHTQFIGRKRVLLFPFEEQYKLYRKPFEVLSLADFSHYYDGQKSKLDFEAFPAVKQAQGFEVVLEHGDTLFMPGGYWHHMEYLDSGFAMSLRALNNQITGKLKGLWNIVGMRNIDTLLKKTAPQTWYEWKKNRIYEEAEKLIERLSA